MTNRKWLATMVLLVVVAIGSIYLKERLSAIDGGMKIAGAGSRSNVLDKGFPSLSGLVKTTKPCVVNISTTMVVKGLDVHGKGDGGFREFFGDDFFDKFFGDVPTREYTQRSLGSGFLIDKEGYILTNNHVVERATTIKVKLSDGKEYDAKVVGKDGKTDIALIKISARSGLPVAAMGDSDKVEVGDWVVAVGNPYGLDHTVTAGIVSAKGRAIGQGPYDDFIQTDASINPGNSGGPLFNLKGEVVGINSAIFSGGQGIGFAIPIKMAKALLPQLKSKGKVVRGWLGVVVQAVTPELARSFGLKGSEGALVSDTVENSPAAKADIRRGDIIVSFDGKRIRGMDQLPRTVAETDVGKKVLVGVIRDGKRFEIPAVVAEAPEETRDVPSQKGPEVEKNLGIVVQNITPEIARHLALKDRKGVIVTDIQPGSPAEDGDLRPGDIIKEINRKSILSVSDFKNILGKMGPKESIVMLAKRDNMTFYAVVRGGKDNR
jgi:serine protease Do